MTYDVILFTDCSSRFWHSKPAGAYRIATELRQEGYSVKVLDYAGEWFAGIELATVLDKIIGQNTLFVGFSGTFFGHENHKAQHVDVSTKIRDLSDRIPSAYPCIKLKFDLWCKFFKKKWPWIKLVYGGAKANSELELNQWFDYMVLGLADRTVIDLASHLKFKTPLKFKPIGKKWKIIDYDVKGLSFNFPVSYTTYLETDHVAQGEVLAIEISRGCLFKCSFCSFPLLGRGKNNPDYHKNKTVLAEEFKRNWDQYKTNKYIFTDDTFNETTEKVQMVLEASKMSGVALEVFAYVRLDLLEQFPEQIALLKEIGVRSVFFGIESLNDASTRAIGKGLSGERIKATLHKCREEWGDDVAIHTNFIVGLPHDTPETVRSWSKWVLEESPADSTLFYPLRLWLKPSATEAAVFHSEFSLNAEKYGYTEYMEGWKNTAWNYVDAIALADELNTSLVKSGTMKLGAMDIMGLMNYGYTFNELKNKRFKDLNELELKSKYKELFEQYKRTLFEFEGINL